MGNRMANHWVIGFCRFPLCWCGVISVLSLYWSFPEKKKKSLAHTTFDYESTPPWNYSDCINPLVNRRAPDYIYPRMPRPKWILLLTEPILIEFDSKKTHITSFYFPVRIKAMDHVNAPDLPYSDCWSLLTPALQENMFNWGKCAENEQSLFRWVTAVQVLPAASQQVLLSEADLDTDDEDLLQMRLISGLIPLIHFQRKSTAFISPHTHLIKTVVLYCGRLSSRHAVRLTLPIICSLHHLRCVISRRRAGEPPFKAVNDRRRITTAMGLNYLH